MTNASTSHVYLYRWLTCLNLLNVLRSTKELCLCIGCLLTFEIVIFNRFVIWHHFMQWFANWCIPFGKVSTIVIMLLGYLFILFCTVAACLIIHGQSRVIRRWYSILFKCCSFLIFHPSLCICRFVMVQKSAIEIIWTALNWVLTIGSRSLWKVGGPDKQSI